MPELPEVEVLVRHLDPQLRGRRILGVEVDRPRVIRPHSPADLARSLVGRRIERVRRRAKYLVFELEDSDEAGPRAILGHLGMTGRMFLQSADEELPRHAAVWVTLDQGRWVFEDTRYFGRFHLDLSVLAELGPEPLAPDFTADLLAAGLERYTQPIKVKLLDQTLLAGVGNIYASEALFRAGISPKRAANRLTRPQVQRLWESIREVLQEAIQGGSTLPLDFAGEQPGLLYYGLQEGSGSSYEERLRVYDRLGKPCYHCQTPIRQLVQAARSTYFCPRCQPR